MITIRNFRKKALWGLAALLLSIGGYQVVTAQPGISPNFAWLRGAALGSDPALVCQGLDTNVDCNIVPQGTGQLLVNGVPVTLSGGTFTSLTINPGPLTVVGAVNVTGTTSLTGPLFVQFGSTATLKRVGAIIGHNITPTGNVGAGEDTVTTYTLPANTLAVNGESAELEAQAFTAANANGKRWRVRWGAGATLVLDSTSVGFNNHAVNIRCIVHRVTAASQNVQCMGQTSPPITVGQAWNVGLGAGVSSQLLAEDMTLAQPITITAEATADNDQVVRSSLLKWNPVGQ